MTERKNLLYLLLWLCLLIGTIVPFFYTQTRFYEYTNQKNELYNSNLQKIKSIDQAVLYVDSLNLVNGSIFDTLNYIKKATRFTKERFYHGVANYSAKENWLANLFGKLFWSHFSAIVISNDILKQPKGLCNQQAIVYMEILRKKGITSRKVGLGDKKGGHFLTEVWYNRSWHLFDVNKEPEWKKISHSHESMEYYHLNPDTLYKAYESRITRATFDKLVEKVEYGKPDEFPAKNMRLFHYITKALTYILPFFFLFMVIVSFLKLKKSAEKRFFTPSKEEMTIEQNVPSGTT